MYVVSYSEARIGFCVFRISGDLSMEFHAGRFSDKAFAESEAKRLNDLLYNAALTGGVIQPAG